MKMSLRWQMVTFSCVLIFLSLTILTFVVNGVLAKNYEKQLRENDVQLANLLEKNIYQTMYSAVELEKALAYSPNLMSQPESVQRELLRSISGERSWYELLALVDMNGMQIARNSGENGDRSGRRWFLDFAATKKNSISPVYYSATTGHPILTLVDGLGKNPDGLIMADINTAIIQNMIDMHNEKSDAAAYLLDAEGTAIAQPDKSQGDGLCNYFSREKTELVRDENGAPKFDENGALITQTKNFSAPDKLVEAMKAAANGEAGTDEYIDDKGMRQLLVYRPVSLPYAETSWSLVVVRPYSSVTAAIADTMNKTMAAGLIMALLVSGGAILFARRITRPLLEIATVAKSARAGNYDGIIPVRTQDEIGMLADTINHMMQSIKATQAVNREAEEQIRNVAYHDALTGLPNRMHFGVYARSTLTESMRKKESGALFFVDVDKFKHVNDTFGHGVGDELLNIFGRRLVMATGKYERVCRFGGDEFLVFFTDMDKKAAELTATTIISLMRTPFVTTHHRFTLSASVGVACYLSDADNIDDLLRKADAALYVAKENGRNRFCFYEEGMEKRQDDVEKR